MASVVFAELQLGLAVPQVEQCHVQRRASEEHQTMRCECRDPKDLVAAVGPSEASRVAMPPPTPRLHQELRT